LTIIQAVFLGIVQGLTEFIPVSSSGHLVIFQHILGIQGSSLTFDIMVHVGTLLAVLAAFWRDIAEILRRPFTRITYLIIVGCIPAGLMGYYLQPLFERFENLLVVGIGLLITGIFLKFSDMISHSILNMKEAQDTTYGDALFIGILQGVAIVPGISRSGATIAAGLVAGLDRTFAARYSFLVAIPVIFGAALVKMKDISAMADTGSIGPYLIGALTAAVTGFVAIKIVMNMVRNGRIAIFSYYCWIVGLFSIGAYFYY
jgi:undecaprenyl-diphosphatase